MNSLKKKKNQPTKPNPNLVLSTLLLNDAVRQQGSEYDFPARKSGQEYLKLEKMYMFRILVILPVGNLGKKTHP